MGNRFRTATWLASGVLVISMATLMMSGALLARSSISGAGHAPIAPEKHGGGQSLARVDSLTLDAAIGAKDESETHMDSVTGGEVIFVTTAGNVNFRRGCSALSAVSLQDAVPVHLGAMSQAYSRMDASSDFSRVMTGPDTGGRERFHALDFDQASTPSWSDRFIRSNEDGLDGLNRPTIQLSGDGRTLYTTVYKKDPGHAGIGEFDLTALERDQAQNLVLGKIKRFYDTDPYFFTRSARGARPGEVHYLGIHRFTADAVVRTLNLVTGDFVGATIPIKSMVAAEGKDMKTAYATLSGDGRYLITNLWYSGEINLVDLEERTSRVVPLDGMTMTGGVAINRGWVNSGLLAVHAGNHVQVLRLNPSTAEAEQLASISVDGPRFWWPPYQQVPAQLAWNTSGEQLIVSVDHDDSEFAVIDVLDEGRQLRIAKYITVCVDEGQINKGLDILTCNGVFDAPPGPDHNTRCFALPQTPTATQSPPEPTATATVLQPTPTTPAPTRPAAFMPLLMDGP